MLGCIIGCLPMCLMSILVCIGLPNVGYNNGLWIAILVIVVEYWVFVVHHWLILGDTDCVHPTDILSPLSYGGQLPTAYTCCGSVCYVNLLCRQMLYYRVFITSVLLHLCTHYTTYVCQYGIVLLFCAVAGCSSCSMLICMHRLASGFIVDFREEQFSG
jgi:hypothetical protein